MANKVLIYGGSGGIGSAAARALRERGYDLHLVARDEEALSAVADEVEASYTVGDVRDGELFPRVMEEVGDRLHGLVYAVGTIHLGSLRRFDEDDFLRDFEVNALGAALAVQAAVRALKKAEGKPSVVFFSSVAAHQGFKLHASMGMAKGAVSGLTVSLAAELAPDVRVNAIAPSIVRTPLADSILRNEQVAEGIAELHPLSRLGTPEDVAALTAFLISPEASWITGEIIAVDGGRSSLRTKG